jgi:hypothetical protein
VHNNRFAKLIDSYRLATKEPLPLVYSRSQPRGLKKLSRMVDDADRRTRQFCATADGAPTSASITASNGLALTPNASGNSRHFRPPGCAHPEAARRPHARARPPAHRPLRTEIARPAKSHTATVPPKTQGPAPAGPWYANSSVARCAREWPERRWWANRRSGRAGGTSCPRASSLCRRRSLPRPRRRVTHGYQRDGEGRDPDEPRAVTIVRVRQSATHDGIGE